MNKGPMGPLAALISSHGTMTARMCQPRPHCIMCDVEVRTKGKVYIAYCDHRGGRNPDVCSVIRKGGRNELRKGELRTHIERVARSAIEKYFERIRQHQRKPEE